MLNRYPEIGAAPVCSGVGADDLELRADGALPAPVLYEVAGFSAEEQEIITVEGDLSPEEYIVSFELPELTAGSYSLAGGFSGLSCKLTITDANGKKVATGSVSNGKLKFKDALLSGGDYTLTVSGSKKSEGAFSIEIRPERLYPNCNNADDDYRNLPTQYTLGCGDLIEDEYVGFGDTVDFRRLTIDKAGDYEVKLLGLTAPVRLTVYEMKSNGSLKKVKSINIKPKYDAKTGTWKNGSAVLQDLMLTQSARYYLQVESTTAKQGDGTDYELYFDGIVYTRGNNADDNYQTLKPEYTVRHGDSIDNEWVGFGDIVDYRKFAIDENGSYSVSISGLTSTVNFTVYEQKSNGKLSAVKSITVKPRFDSKTGTWSNSAAALDNLLLSSLGNYYIKIEAPSVGKGENTDYNISIGGSVFDNPYNQLLNNSWIEVKNSSGQPLSSILNEWVGYGDPADWFKLAVDDLTSGNYDFKLTLEQAKAADMTLYRVDEKGKLKKVASGSFLDGIDLGAGTYALLVESRDKGKGKYNTSYEVDIRFNEILPSGNNGRLA